MNISRFLGSTNREALRQVRLALGPDALIVSNRRVNGGVEILATDATSAEAAAASAAPMPSGAVSPPEGDTGVEVMSAIGEMRGALEARMDDLMWGNQLRRVPQAAALFQTMLGFGFSTALLRAMLKRLPEALSGKAAVQWVRQELIAHLPVLESEDDLWTRGRAIALVGPTGVGKTTTIAKLAARCVRRASPDSLVLLTTDTYRIGAHEQLKIYGQMMRVPVHVAQDVDELQAIIRQVHPDQTLLIDNVGISQRGHYIAEQAAMLAGAGRPVSRLLVLNATSHGDTLDEVARSYVNDGGSPLAGCIITKVDEASRTGASLDTALRYQLPIHFVSIGQKVPEDLMPARPAELVDQALAHSNPASVLYAPTEADFAALMSLSKPAEDNTGKAAAEQRRKQWLPGLLSMVGGGALAMDDLHAACDFVDDDIALAQAYGLWRAPGSSDGAVSLEGSLRHLERVARNALAEESGPLLAVHDQLALTLQNGLRGHLRASLLLSGRGKALTTPLQQLGFPGGWVSSAGESASAAPAAGDALLRQIMALGSPSSLMHLFEGGSQALWRKVNGSGVRWMAQVSGTTRVTVDDEATTVGALAKTLPHQPLAAADLLAELDHVAGIAVNDLVIWAACSPVTLLARRQAPLVLQMVCLRLVHRQNGNVIKTLHGLGAPHDGAAPSWLAACLLIRAEARSSLRNAAQLWRLLEQDRPEKSEQEQAMAAVQCAMAAWRLGQCGKAHAARSVAASLIGKPALPPSWRAPALLKLFALKALMP